MIFTSQDEKNWIQEDPHCALFKSNRALPIIDYHFVSFLKTWIAAARITAPGQPPARGDGEDLGQKLPPPRVAKFPSVFQCQNVNLPQSEIRNIDRLSNILFSAL